MSDFFNFFEDSASNPSRLSSGGSSIDWNAIINQGFAIGSQAINSYSGQNSGTQIGYNPSQGGVFAIQPNVQQPNYGANPYANMTPAQVQAYQNSLGGGVGSGIDGIMTWIGQNPMIVLGAGVGAYLLFKQPPGRR